MEQRHECHAEDCRLACKPEHLMCPRHWKMVPREIQRRVWANYRPGQCDDKRPSEAWLRAARAAIAAVKRHEGRQRSFAFGEG